MTRLQDDHHNAAGHSPLCPDTAGSTSGRGPSSLRIVTATRTDDLDRILPDWEHVLQHHGTRTPYNDPHRFAAELRASSGAAVPHVAVFFAGNEPQGLIVGRLEYERLRYRVAYWTARTPKIHILHVVHGGLIAGSAIVSPDAIATHLASLLSDRQVDLIAINHLPLSNPMYPVLRRLKADPSPAMPHWRRRIVADASGAVIGVFSSKHRSELRRTDRLLREHFRQQVSLRVFQHQHELREFIAGTTAISTQTYQMQLGAGFAGTTLWREILKTEALHGHLRCYWLVCADKPIAFQVGAVYDSTYFGYFTGYLPDHAPFSPGTVLHMRVLQDLYSMGVTAFDYGFGDAGYKRGFGADSHDETSLKLYGKGLAARLAAALECCTGFTNHLASACAQRLGMKDRLRRRWRGRLARSTDDSVDSLQQHRDS